MMMIKKKDIDAKEVRKLVIQQSYRANIGHIGSALSIVDILAALYSSVIQLDDIKSNNRDRFILSNGHTSLALYVVLHLLGIITEVQLNSFCTDGSVLGVHPDIAIPGIDFCTGSLGQGITYAAGAALAARMQHSNRRVYTIISDAECNEGSVWEAAMFASQQKLANLVVTIDLNGQQAMGYTKDVLNLSPMADKWKTFGWDVHSVDGNDFNSLVDVYNSLDTKSGSPHLIVAKTLFGKGVSFMEKQIKWHYMPLKSEQYLQALAEIESH